ncbi:MAG: YcjF family protein [Prevotella sp.]|nr:YcjF family protein [Prevotella sp.]
MKRNLILISSIFLSILFILLAGNVITIGEKIYELTGVKYIEYGFYALIFIFFVWIIIIPFVRLHHTPTFPKLQISDEEELDEEKQIAKLTKFSKKLSNNLYYLPEEERQQHKETFLAEVKEYYNADDLKQIVQKELEERYKKVKSHIHEWAKTEFLITTISQSSRIDAIASLVINFRMIGDLIRCSGFRPTNQQLFYQYCRILATSLFSYYLSDGISSLANSADGAADGVADGIADADLDTFSEAGFLGSISSMKLTGLVSGSLIGGTLNTLLTLRIGYVTLTYLKSGSKALEGKNGIKVRRRAMLQAATDFLSIAKETGSNMTEQSYKIITDKVDELLHGKKEESADQEANGDVATASETSPA